MISKFHAIATCITVMRNVAIASVRSSVEQHYSRSFRHNALRYGINTLALRHSLRFSVSPFAQRRGLKSIVNSRMNDLPTKATLSNNRPLQNGVDGLVYPTVVQQARNNMRQFDKCVLLTRVGNFYEVGV